MKSSQRASEWPATARKLRPRNSWNHYRAVLNGERYTRSPVNNSAARPSLRSPINADPTEPEFRGFIGSPIAPTDLEACPRRRKRRREKMTFCEQLPENVEIDGSRMLGRRNRSRHEHQSEDYQRRYQTFSRSMHIRTINIRAFPASL